MIRMTPYQVYVLGHLNLADGYSSGLSAQSPVKESRWIYEPKRSVRMKITGPNRKHANHLMRVT